jgi:methylenetetrahydrofolate reductase (NADPH)
MRCGASWTRAITQYFFDTDVYLRFLDRCLAAGITAPVVPGIMPVSNFAQIARFSALCGASVPDWLGRLFEGAEDEPELRRMIGIVVAAEQVRLLQANGVDEFHFYTLNRPELTYAIAHLLGCRPTEPG